MTLFGGSSPASREYVFSAFVFPWSDKPAPRTVFRALTEAGRLHFRFDVSDDDIVVSPEWQGKSTVNREDRVELFFAKDPTLSDYWCLEIDPLGRVHDYRARYYRHFDPTWDCAGLVSEGRLVKGGYEVEASLPLATLTDLLGRVVEPGSELLIGIYRAEFYGHAAATHGEADDNWLCWVRPETDHPDFHVPSSFRPWRLP